MYHINDFLAMSLCQVGEFKPFVPLIAALRQDGMRDRHWDQISDTLALDVHPSEQFTLTSAISMGLLGHLDSIQEVSELASKEFAIEVALQKMQDEWKSLELAVLTFPFEIKFVLCKLKVIKFMILLCLVELSV